MGLRLPQPQVLQNTSILQALCNSNKSHRARTSFGRAFHQALTLVEARSMVFWAGESPRGCYQVIIMPFGGYTRRCGPTDILVFRNIDMNALRTFLIISCSAAANVIGSKWQPIPLKKRNLRCGNTWKQLLVIFMVDFLRTCIHIYRCLHCPLHYGVLIHGKKAQLEYQHLLANLFPVCCCFVVMGQRQHRMACILRQTVSQRFFIYFSIQVLCKCVFKKTWQSVVCFHVHIVLYVMLPE